MDDNWLKQAPDSQRHFADIARRALEAFRADAKEAYAQLVKEYDDSSAVIGVFGLGTVTLSVSGGEAFVHDKANDKASGKADDKAPAKPARLIARGAAYPETILALSEGRVTAVEAFHSGDLIVRAPSEELHRAFGLMVKFSDTAIRSEQLQGVLKEFRELARSSGASLSG